MDERCEVMIIGSEGAVAIWMNDKEHATYRRCSFCDYVYKLSYGKLPDECPECGTKMIKGSASRSLREIILSLERDDQKRNVKNVKHLIWTF